MAEKRMFAKTIVMSDDFLDMPSSARCLYFTLGMFADDDGFVNNPKSIMRQSGASLDDMNILIAKKYVISFESGVIVIRHWRVHNYIKSDRYHTTICTDEKKQLTFESDGKTYVKGVEISTMVPEWNQNGTEMEPQYRLDEIRLDEKYIVEIINFLNEKAGTKYRHTSKKTASLIRARLNEGFTVDDFKDVIQKKVDDWRGTEWWKFIRPETLFGTKFESYLNQSNPKGKDEGRQPSKERDEEMMMLEEIRRQESERRRAERGNNDNGKDS